MPIPKPQSSENEQEFISRCISEIHSEYDSNGQAFAVCKSSYDSSVELAEQLPAVKSGENLDTYIRRCVPTIYKSGGDYDQRVATSMCADHYEGKTTEMSSIFRKIKGIKLD